METQTPDSVSSPSFQDTSTECGICLEPFESQQEEQLTVIKLSCGHRWHLTCLRDQLRHADPYRDHSQRIIFSGCRCAKCGTVCEHESIRHLTRPTDALRAKVDEMIKEQLGIPESTTTTDGEINTRMEEARRAFAFYMCPACEEPYYGGTVFCADLDDDDDRDDPRHRRRLCPSCTPQTVCPRPHEHRGSFQWKCRYCCRPAALVCYGSVHFCNDCHERNRDRYQQINNTARRNRPALEPVPCPGGNACPFPKPTSSVTKHDNGPDASCEQVYGCLRCQSAQHQCQETHAPGSHNLLQNPCGRDGIRGWEQINQAWQVEASELPARTDCPTNFVSTFRWCIMTQTVDLSRFIRRVDATQQQLVPVPIQVSAKYTGRTDCPSVFQLEAVLLNTVRRGRPVVLHHVKTPVSSAPADCWEQATLDIPPTDDAHAVMVVVKGKDERFWAGSFGSKVTDISVRILGSPEYLRDSVLLLAQIQQRQSQTQHVTVDEHRQQEQERQVTIPAAQTIEVGGEIIHGRTVFDWRKYLFELWPVVVVITLYLWKAASPGTA